MLGPSSVKEREKNCLFTKEGSSGSRNLCFIICMTVQSGFQSNQESLLIKPSFKKFLKPNLEPFYPILY